MSEKTLVVFDFDHTILDDNADTSVFNLIKNKEMARRLWDQYEEGKWTEFMNKVMTFLHDKQVTWHEIQQELIGLPLVPGMSDLLEYIDKNPACDCIIVSDANSLFIETILESKSLISAVKEVFTNPAVVNEIGKIVITPCHKHNHLSCPVNMCKGTIVGNYQQKMGEKYYQKVCYVGDGSNDLCPCLKLSSSDFAFPRIGYSLAKKLDRLTCNVNNSQLHASVVKWNSGLDILNFLKSL